MKTTLHQRLRQICVATGLLITILSVSMGRAHAQKNAGPLGYDQVDQKPEFPGGMPALYQYLAKGIRYPDAEKKAGTGGKVLLGFVVDESGNIRDVTVIRPATRALDAEAVRVVSASPRWKPGKINGENVPVSFQMPIAFNARK
ncbi:energy transducer TonB [Pedobacter yulinensis]|uniref:Energy transducer TonB n=1 Tax=Pedobacter yulinensis TaxID=2126353 RepID=A0A2T3HR18_9SPHI|nr:energy transducer TonB [Pedobacter yulinensis]PST84837.1 energy transducer TonB [Pedobacter yulinensis]